MNVLNRWSVLKISIVLSSLQARTDKNKQFNRYSIVFLQTADESTCFSHICQTKPMRSDFVERYCWGAAERVFYNYGRSSLLL